MGFEVVDEVVEIVGKNPYCASKYLAKFPNFWNNTIIGRLKLVWSTWIRHNLFPNYDHERLLVIKLLLDCWRQFSLIDQI